VHGFDAQVVWRQPDLYRDVDVTVFHPHGFLPRDEERADRSDFLILSQDSYDERMGEQMDPWKSLISSVLLSKIGLFVGLSGSDPTFGPFLKDVMTRITRPGTAARPTGFWLLHESERDIADRLRRRNVVPVLFGDLDQIPSFLLGVCQLAGAAAE